MRLALAALAVSAAAAAAVPASDGARPAPCSGPRLRAAFAVVPGSAGAGNIVYALRVTNRSARSCTVTGLPSVRLLGKAGKPLPTRVVAAFPGALTAALVTLAPGRSARATARFSPDVPGVGEGNRARCEPVAYRLRVLARGGGSSVAAIRPPTPVCEHGRLQFRAYGPAG